jgi:hypothetical protein
MQERKGIFIFGAHVLPSFGGNLTRFDSLHGRRIFAAEQVWRLPQAPTDVTVIDFRCSDNVHTVDPWELTLIF